MAAGSLRWQLAHPLQQFCCHQLLPLRVHLLSVHLDLPHTAAAAAAGALGCWWAQLDWRVERAEASARRAALCAAAHACHTPLTPCGPLLLLLHLLGLG
jgi:hypothetical protein